MPEISFRKIAFIEPSSVEHGLGKIRQVQVAIDESRKRKIGAAEIRPDELACLNSRPKTARRLKFIPVRSRSLTISDLPLPNTFSSLFSEPGIRLRILVFQK